MYIRDIDAQLPLEEFQIEDVHHRVFPNVTKEISDVLRLCQSAGLDPHGVGCGVSVPSSLKYLI
jgi:hypothetical protein